MEEKELKSDVMERVILEATYYSQGKSTVMEASKRFGVCKKTFLDDINNKLYLAVTQKILSLEEKLKNTYDLDEKKYLENEIKRMKVLPFEIIRVKTKAINVGNVKGGKNGKRKSAKIVTDKNNKRIRK